MVSDRDVMLPSFYDMWGDIQAGGHTHYWLKGGRGSTKSSFISICIVFLIMLNPFANAVVIRRIGNTLRTSVYAQMVWAIETLGVVPYFHFAESTMEITYKPTGQRIVFRGSGNTQESTRLKSTKFPKGYCAIIWFEELDQFDSMESIRSILNSLRRGGDKFWIFYSYNPPKVLWSWVNREALERENRPDTLVHTSSYLDAMDSHPEWIGQPFIDEAEYLRDTNEVAYRWEYLGEITGTGGNVFDNLVRRRVTDEEIYTFDNRRYGVDFGWFPDPWRLVVGEWQPGSRRLIIYEEHSRNKTLPRDTGQIIVDALTFKDRPEDAEPRYHHETIWCDDTSDGKTNMGVYRRDYGLNARPARKGNMRKLSYIWLSGLREIVIDPYRCPKTFEEFALCEYMQDKDGNWMEDFNDGNDHSIDAVRYMMMEEVIRGR